MMTPEYIQTLRRLMEFEASRKEPPEGFPRYPTFLPSRYTDPRFYQLEREYIWRKSWLLAAHIDEIPEPGCYMLWDNAGQPVVIVHADTGTINAFYNTCSHRGAPVVTDERGKSRRLTCKYHGWSYDHEGELRGIRDPQDFRDFDMSCRGLRKVRCEQFGNLIFVNFDPEAISLLEWRGQSLTNGLSSSLTTVVWRQTIFDLDCNWKIASRPIPRSTMCAVFILLP